MKKIIAIIFSFLLIITIAQVSINAQRLNLYSDESQNIDDNSPPDKPKITVPDTIKVGRIFKVEVEFSDPDGDDIYFRFDASFLPMLPQYWLGPFPSNIVYEAWVTYRGPTGVYEIGVQAKDIHEAESDWTYVQFNITKSRYVNTNLVCFFQNYYELFPLFRQILLRYISIMNLPLF